VNNAFDTVVGIVVATIGGAAVGLERQWSGHASGPNARFAGIRTFTLLGMLAGICGWLWTEGQPLAAAALLACAAALVVVAYAAASHRDVEGTTEVAALVVLAAGTMSGLGYLTLGSGVIAVSCLLLAEKTSLHAFARRFDDTGIRAGARFAVMAIVVLPLLPQGPFGPLGGLRPRTLWALVLFFSGLSFVGYVARRMAGARHGYPMAGLIGGLISSTNVTFTFARTSREPGAPGLPLAAGVVAACTVMLLRVLVACLVLNAPLALALVPFLTAPFAVGAAALVFALRTRGAEPDGAPEPENPLQIGAALQMAGLFQLVLFGVYLLEARFGNAGLFVSGAVLGLTDLDALTISMARSSAASGVVSPAARAIAIGVLSNTLLKGALAAVIGRGRFRPLAVAGLGLMAVAVAASLLAAD
jgi:uncharacterized membrane protein (DUF4010 family)